MFLSFLVRHSLLTNVILKCSEKCLLYDKAANESPLQVQEDLEHVGQEEPWFVYMRRHLFFLSTLFI